MYQDRIIELRRMRAGDLRANPKNWRRHPKTQQDAMRGVLKEVGFADALLAYQTPEGLTLVDGHLRAGLEPDQEVPVLVLDLDEAEAEKLLVTLDPLAAMAETDADALAALLADLTFSDESITAMLDGLALGGEMALELEPDEVIYTQELISPIYKPTGEVPPVSALYDVTTTQMLVAEIAAVDMPEDLRGFLVAAAQRHTVLDFSKIANYYAHAGTQVQKLMEASALIIIDSGQAIERGFMKLHQDILTAYDEQRSDE